MIKVSRWRVVLLVALVAAPFVFLASYGGYCLWERGLSFVTWWPMAACFALAYGLGWYWQRQNRLLPVPDLDVPLHWTERDQQAWQLVVARAKEAPKLDADPLGKAEFYLATAREMALELARFYHPGAEDPVGSLTLPEVLAVVELASHDLAELVDQYLPGGHLLTIRNWQQARQAADWYRTASNIYWAISAIFSPVSTGMRYAASQLGMSQPWSQLQQNLLVWFYTAFVHRTGTYLIEVNSGRLRVGARRYRELVQGVIPPADGQALSAPPDPADQVRQVTITVLGQVKAGKSSVINALLGEQRAATDVLPLTAEITRYELQPPGVPTRLVLLDTVGYGHEGPKADQVRATHEAARQSDLLLLVMQARNPARRADAEGLEELQRWFTTQPQLRMPPVLGVVTHIDLLSPAMEWSPPYDWQKPSRPKEQQIQLALTAVRDQMGPYLVGAVPVCAAAGRVYGVQEWLLPTILELLGDAHAVGLLRCLRAEADAAKVRRVLNQLLAVGHEAARVVLEGFRR